MRKLLGSLAALSLFATPALADPKIEDWNTPHALGCMLLKECTDDVVEITSMDDIKSIFPDRDFRRVEREMNQMIAEFKRIGIGVYISSSKYFPPLTRGVYYTPGNSFFLNERYMWDADTLIEVSRHEGWHAVQDCMAGSIHNSSIAVIWNDGVVPRGYKLRAEVAYASMPAVIPWETEALWAGETPFQTVNALKACARSDQKMWDVYPPTPKTGEWLINNGYWNGVTK